MSRSCKKHPWKVCGSGNRSKAYFKKYANRSFRRNGVNLEIANGRSYRKFFDRHTICDWKMLYDPRPWVYSSYKTGELEWVEADPLWKWDRK